MISGLLSGQNIDSSAGLDHSAVPEVNIRVLSGHRLLHRDRLRFTREVDLNRNCVLPKLSRLLSVATPASLYLMP